MPNVINGKITGSGISWPDGKRIAVMLTTEFEAELLQISQLARQGLTAGDSELEQGYYAANEGIWRVLNAFETHDVKGTFFIPGWVIEQYPEQVKAVHAAGHEIAYHGYKHEPDRDTSREDEVKKFEKCEALIKGVTGKNPVGYRAPHSVVHPDALDIIEERGYLYSSNFRDCDWAYMRDTKNGKPLVEIPCENTMDDFIYFFYSCSMEPGHRVPFTNQDYANMVKEEFDALALEGDKVLVLKLHPDLIGRPGRAQILADLIAYMKTRGAWITTCEEVANYVKNAEGRA
ncbi:polysaccharide deacetylase family protein [Oscillospiraceae bacterium OttesenSCG-928-G22]|nr:polysaccharide deacetylase family protein [Oscillospiraceae bacterium OttesenSCG-928-G22]